MIKLISNKLRNICINQKRLCVNKFISTENKADVSLPKLKVQKTRKTLMLSYEMKYISPWGLNCNIPQVNVVLFTIASNNMDIKYEQLPKKIYVISSSGL